MIFYFSGTGNSLYLAKKIAEKQGEEIISISKEMALNKAEYVYDLKENEKVIFVYPIYAWAPPKILLEFVKKMKLNNYKNNYICGITTCGENTGNAMELINKELKKKNLALNSAFSVVMPNNYMIMGDVSTEEESNNLIKEADRALERINEVISSKINDMFELEKGPMPKLMSYVINPLFNKFSINAKKFYVTDECIGCKICEKVCNTGCIKVDKVPTWKGKCTQCLACINYCPKKAIQFGKGTESKGRYVNPHIKIDEMM